MGEVLTFVFSLDNRKACNSYSHEASFPKDNSEVARFVIVEVLYNRKAGGASA